MVSVQWSLICWRHKSCYSPYKAIIWWEMSSGVRSTIKHVHSAHCSHLFFVKDLHLTSGDLPVSYIVREELAIAYISLIECVLVPRIVFILWFTLCIPSWSTGTTLLLSIILWVGKKKIIQNTKNKKITKSKKYIFLFIYWVVELNFTN